MATFYYESARGDRLSLTDAENYSLVNIDSQTFINTNVSSLVTGGVDGDEVNNIQAQPRTIILDLRITADVETTKRQILSVFKPKQKGTLYWSQDDRTLQINGIVESIEMPRWTKDTTMQITLHCWNPYWTDIDEVISSISAAISLHYFTDAVNDMLYFPAAGIALGEYDTARTKEIFNSGDVEVGLEIEIIAYSTVTNPIIYNQNAEYFGIGYGTGSKQLVLSVGDVIRINTTRNNKSVTLNNVTIYDKIKPQSTWLQLETGNNAFAVNSDDSYLDNMTFSIKYTPLYI